ncbi:MAG: DUF6288 domain-containing protein [Akkermansiaceae bacterium]
MNIIKPYVSSFRLPIILGATLALAFNPAIAQDKSYYKDKSGMKMFNPYPNDTGRHGKKSWLVRNFGPVGIGINLKRPGMTMEVHNVEKGSPAEATGKLKKGQIIESINGVVLKDIDPRIILGDIITAAEAKDGKINLKIKGEGNVLVKIPVMGSYSKTWPVDCAKSDKIVRGLADVLAKEEKPQWGSVLFLLSTGEEKDLAVVKKWMKGIETIGGMNWEKGYKGPGLCEYYLRTGDQSVLPVIKKMTEELKVHMYNGGWSGRGAPAAFTYSTGTGQVHASGVNCMTFLMMAQLCGVEVDDYMFSKSMQQFFRFSGRGNVAYGNGLPEGGFRDNGKTSGLACAMAVAAKLLPDGEKSVYAGARDNSAMKSFYATNWFHAAHTGGGIGEIWHHGAMALMKDQRPTQYRSYHDTRRWVMELSRRHDGSIGIAGMDDRYDRSATEASGNRAWGTYFGLTYTYPRKKLQIWGAPRSKWAKHFKLPARPWGNEADDVFQSIEPIPGGKLTVEDLLKETVEDSVSVPVLAKLADPNLTDDTLLKYIYHPEYAFRSLAMSTVVQRGRVEFVVPLLRSKDARLRQAGLLTLTGMFKGKAFSEDKVTPEMYDLVGAMVDDPKESWWVAMHAIQALKRAKPERIAKHRDRLLEFLKYDSVWVQTAAVVTLSKIATSPDHYKVVLPPILKAASEFTVDSASSSSTRAIADVMKSAKQDIKDFAKPLLKDTYAGMPSVLKEPYTGAVMSRGAKTVRSRIGSIVQQLPGGDQFVKMIPKTTLQSYISGKDSDMYRYSGKFTPNKQMVGKWAWCVWPQPKTPQEVDTSIKKWLKPRLAKNPTKVDRPKDMMQLSADGKVKSKFFSGYFWSGDTLAGINDDQALKMEVRTVEGYDFLIVEKGGFNVTPDSDEENKISKDYHCGYHIYIRQK